MSKPINEMTLDELSAYVVILPGWRWMEGMKIQINRCGRRMVTVGHDAVRLESGWVSLLDLLTNPTVRVAINDPATIGCLLALAREAWGDPALHVVYWPSPDMGGKQWAVKSGGMRAAGSRWQSEAHALIAALAAAPAKEAK